MKKTIKFTENILKKMIAESVKRILKENQIDSKGQWEIDDFYNKDTLGKKIWDLMYKYQKSGNPNLVSQVADLLNDTFSGIHCTITTPNTGRVLIKVTDNNGKPIAVLDEFDEQEINLPKIQEFLDKINRYDGMMNEGFRKFGKPAAQSNGQKKGNLQIAYAKTDKARSAVTGQEKEFIAVCLGHVWKDGAQKLVDAINSAVPKNVMNATLGNGNERVVIRVNIDAKNEIPNVVAKLEAAIKQVGEYTDTSVETVCSQIYDSVDSVATSADVENAQNKGFENWKEMLQKLEDPEVRKRLLKYQTTNDYARAYGHILSPGNVQDVLDQFPSASFVAEKSTWSKVFNRTVQPGAQRIVVTKPIQSQPSMADLDAAAKSAGFASYKDAKIQTKNATQVMSEINNLEKRKTSNFIKVVMYDVSQTTPPSDPKLDIWTNEIGLSDNITGALNTHAETFDNQITGGDAKAKQDANKLAISKAQEAKWLNRKYALLNLCKQKNIDITNLKNLPDNEFIAQATYTYAKTIMPNYGIIKTEEINKISAIVAAAICFSSDCQVPSSLSKFIYNVGNTTDTEYKVAYTISRDILPKLAKSIRAKNVQTVNNESVRKVKAMLKEGSENIITPDELFRMLQRDFGNETEEEVFEAKQIVKNLISKLVKEEINRQHRKTR